MNSLFELSLRESASDGQIKDLLGHWFGLSSSGIVDEVEYWDAADDQGKLLGVSVFVSNTGFRERICGVASFDVTGEDLSGLASYFASELKTEVVIGDYRGGQDRFLVYFPNGSIAEAVDSSVNGVNDVSILRFI